MDILYKIPDSWIWTTLNELFLIERGGSPRPIQQFLTDEADGINWIKIGDTELGQKYIETTKEKIKPEGLKKSRLVVDGDFILSNSMSFGRPYIVKTTGAIHDGWLVFRDVDNNLDKDFFYYLLSSSYVYQQFSRNASGSTVRNLNIDIVKQTNISLPPLNEQKRIVAKIEKLFSNLDNSDKYLLHLEKQLKRYRQSVLKSAFEGELTKEWREKQTNLETADELLEKIKIERILYIEKEIREKFKDKTEKWIKDKVKIEVEKFYTGLKHIEDDEKPFKVPNHWIWVRLDELSKKITDGTHFTPTYINEGISFISVKDIRNKKINFENCKYISEEEHKELYQRCNPENDDVLITKSGTIGRTCVVNVDREFSLFVSVALIKPFTNLLNPYYLMYRLDNYINMTDIQQTIKGGVIKNLHIVDMRQLVFPIFSLAEQNEIVKQIEKHFSIIDKLELNVQQSIKESKRLRQSILKQAFEGKLVEQDPNDESASVLLEKIAKAKEEYQKAQKKQVRKK